MAQRVTSPDDVVSPWLIGLGSAVIAGHLFAVIVMVLAAPSGPWPSPDGYNLAMPPEFAQAINRETAPAYLMALKMTHNYHFPSNRPALPGAYFDVRLKDAQGQPLATLHFPDPDANFWVRHRQTLLARHLTEDQPIPPPQGEAVAAPNRQLRTVRIWENDGPRSLKILDVPEHLVPRDRPVFTPGDWSLLLARSYVRHLCRAHGAASGELVRHTRDALPPAALLMGEPPPGAQDDLVANFGDMPRE